VKCYKLFQNTTSYSSSESLSKVERRFSILILCESKLRETQNTVRECTKMCVHKYGVFFFRDPQRKIVDIIGVTPLSR